MPSLPSIRRKFRALFTRPPKDREPSAEHPKTARPRGGKEAASSSSAGPSATSGPLPPIVIDTSALCMTDFNHSCNLDTGLSEPSLVHPAIDLGGHGTLPERPLMKANSTLSPFPPAPPPAASASYFSKARDFTVSSLTINNHSAESKALFEYLNPHISHGAAHDSSERCDAPACHEETRVAIRDDILSWIKHGNEDDEPKKIMWLSGPAGAGKSAIAGSVAEACKEEGLLAASFFFSSFSGSADRCSKRCLVATLAYHLSQHNALRLFETHLLAVVSRHPDIFHKKLKEQAECLILGPLRMIQGQGDTVSWPKVVIIDGLDEVVATAHRDRTGQRTPRTPEEEQVEILNVLLTLSQSPAFPFHIFIASRPEHNIVEFFNTNAQDLTVDLFLDSKYNPDADVERFLKSKFALIRRRAGITIPSWPGQPALDRLVEMSSGQFIVPVTIIRWVEGGLPQRQLDDILKLVPIRNKNPFATLDALYRHILKRSMNHDSDPHLLIKWILSIQSGVSTTAKFWRQFLQDEEGELSYRLAPISSLISVPPPDDTSPITIYHKSLSDFLSSPTRCRDLYVNEMGHRSFVSDRVLKVLKNKGPVVPLSSSQDLADFLLIFFFLRLFVDSTDFLGAASESSRRELSSYDVAWWTTVSLSVLRSLDGSELLQDGVTNPPEQGWGPHPWLVRSIYCGVHRAMGCSSNELASAKPLGQQAEESNCHGACVRWRTGILAKAKELGWCVHALEDVKLDKLAYVTPIESNLMFNKVGEIRFDTTVVASCAICQPLPTDV
ncbi:hypothetical protein FA13DRAFT_1743239 [Coprinellus micaceus]|uniref:Nephrocystin 3-like N-terminal domain-containing protein n=1 Tax=Coprinellus micaceus TaxID=71717 RepID=A0A4Y7SF58_COPMI|nr:hypothetical protein FA13DRAFT_1743239 [Coprinellus micaceus]